VVSQTNPTRLVQLMDYFSINWQEKGEEFSEEQLKNLSFEEKKEIVMKMIEEEKQLVLHEPWTIANLDEETREKILEQFTPEEQEQMAVRCELEHQRCKETGKGLGDG